MKKLSIILALILCFVCFSPCLSEEESSSESAETKTIIEKETESENEPAETSAPEDSSSDSSEEEETSAGESEGMELTGDTEESTEGSAQATEAPAETAEPDSNPYTTWYGVVSSEGGGMDIPVYYQTDYPQTICVIDGLPRSVESSGCGATCASMVIAYFTGDTVQNPYTIFCEAVDASYYNGAGFSHEAISWVLERHGIQSEWIYNDGQAIYDALNSGKPVIAHMGEGIFTKHGHFVVLRGVTSDGKILLNDPISPTKTGKAFPIETLLTQAKDNHSFCVCEFESSGEEVEEHPQEPIG